MKLVKLYTNREDIFPTIQFGKGFNVVFARVKDPKRKDLDSHNLGKTFLADVIDFCLLSKIDKIHPFRKKPELFGEFIFFLEIKTKKGKYVTIRREVASRSPIRIHAGDESRFLAGLPEADWMFQAGIAKSVGHLDDLLGLDVVSPYSYRKGLRYFLRRQADYGDVFEISKFMRGRHKDWKPFMTLLLGFDQDIFHRKYELDDEISAKILERDALEKKSGSKDAKYDEIKGLIEIKETAANKLRSEVDGFSFHGMESEINEDVVSRIERRISDLNQERYTLDYEIGEIDKSLQTEYPVDVDKMLGVFREMRLVMPETLARDYKELEDFNKRISVERTRHLRQLRKKLGKRRNDIESDLQILDEERRESLAILSQKESFVKFRELQKRVLRDEEEILALRQRLEQLDEAGMVNRQIERKRRELAEAAEAIRQTIRGDNPVYRDIRQTFAEYVREILNVPAQIFTELNAKGNPDFRYRIVYETSGLETHETRGTSYKKILCACFDLALLSVHASRSFYRFVYHDGIFEGLDNRKKVSLLNLVRSVCDEKGIQYILTVIDTDLPRDDRDRKLMFTEDEIARRLHDDGKDGRLFRMEKF